jgi:polyhydroxyalkanoate synthase
VAVGRKKKELEIIDPFSDEYRNLATVRDDAHYKELYEEIFNGIPTRARAALVKNYVQYINEYAKPFFSFLNPFSWMSPQALLDNTLEIVDKSLGSYVGLSNLLYDQMASLKLVEKSSNYFQLGKNIATTPCDVVYQSPLLTLKRYIPKGKKVHRTPLLMVYSIINGYYILDLTEELSMIRYFVEKGYDVFVTDWNPITEETKSATLEDHIVEVAAAREFISELTGEGRIGGLGYCIGGTYLDIEAALHNKYKYIINLTTLLDSKIGESGAGLMGAFSDFSIYDIDAFIETHNGVFPGEVLKSFFDWVKPEKAANMFMDLYFYGKEYKYGNDAIFFWNTHSTRDLPGPAHREFLWEIYYENNLAKNKMRILNKTLNLKDITVPFCNVAALFDHIVEFSTALSTAYLIGTPAKDQVTIKVNGGHVRGIVNPTLYPLLEKFTRQYSGSKNRSV